jgi:hypothetical protein
MKQIISKFLGSSFALVAVFQIASAKQSILTPLEVVTFTVDYERNKSNVHKGLLDYKEPAAPLLTQSLFGNIFLQYWNILKQKELHDPEPDNITNGDSDYIFDTNQMHDPAISFKYIDLFPNETNSDTAEIFVSYDIVVLHESDSIDSLTLDRHRTLFLVERQKAEWKISDIVNNPSKEDLLKRRLVGTGNGLLKQIKDKLQQ